MSEEKTNGNCALPKEFMLGSEIGDMELRCQAIMGACLAAHLKNNSPYMKNVLDYINSETVKIRDGLLELEKHIKFGYDLEDPREDN